MSSLSNFRFDPDKFVDAVAFLLREVGPATRMKIVKLLYLADRYHLAHHGTPILGDRYYALPWGPVPSRALGLLQAGAAILAKSDGATLDSITTRLLRSVAIDDPTSVYTQYRIQLDAPRPDSLSRSEMDALSATAGRFGKIEARDLSDLTHQHATYLKTSPAGEIDYELFFLDEPEVDPDAVAYFEATRADRALLEELRS